MSPLFHFEYPLELSEWSLILYLILATGILFLSSTGYTFVRKINLIEELSKRDNPASAVSFAGYLASVGIVLAAVFQSPSKPELGVWGNILDSLFWGSGSVALLLLALLINDRFIFFKFKNRKEIIDDRNTGLAVSEASSFISTALIIKASLTLQLSPTSLPEPWLTLVYFLFGQAMFVIYSKIYPKVAKIKLHKELEKDNPAVGLAFSGSLLAFSFLLSNAISFYDGLPTILTLSIVYLLLLMTMRTIILALLSKKFSLTEELEADKNWGLGIIEATLSLVTAYIVIASF